MGRKIEVIADKISETQTLINTSEPVPGIYWLPIFVENNSIVMYKVMINP